MRVASIVCVLVAGALATAEADPRLDRVLAEQACSAHEPSCNWLATLSSLERASVARALAARGYVLEPEPWGKTIGAIRVYNEDVFAEGSAFLRFFNKFHVTTRESAIEQEAVMSPGEIWDQEKINETARRLRDPLWTSVIAVVPVKSATPGTVDALVVTRDIWSLRLNTNYTYQLGSLTNLNITLSENNFLGNRNVVAMAFAMDQGAIAAGPLFIDKNLLGKHYSLSAQLAAIYTRDDLFDRGKLNREGSRSSISLSKSLWRLSEQWGANFSFGHSNAISRTFNGLGLRQIQCPLDGSQCVNPADPSMVPPEELLPRIYSLKTWSTSAEATRQWGYRWKQQFTFGYGLSSVKAAPLGDFAGDDVQRASFIRDVLPRSEFVSSPFVSYSIFTPKFRTVRNISTYDLAEDLRFGPTLTLSYTVGVKALGSDNNFQTGVASTTYNLPWARDGLLGAALGVGTRLEDGDFIDNTTTVSARAVTPTMRYARIVAEASLATRWNDSQNRFFTLGGADNGLRGFQINELFGARTGDRRVLAQIEARSIPVPFWVLRVGGVAFYEVGSVADTLREIRLHNDVGIGLRMLIPQTARELFRFDIAVPLDSTVATRAGQLRFTAGFDSAF